MKLLVLLLLGLLGLVLPGRGQAAAPPPEVWPTIFFENPAVALPLLVAAAVQHSAALEAIKTDQRITHEDLQMARKAILSSIILSNNFGYGNIASVTVADQSLLSNVGSTSSQTHYSTAINLNLPLDRLVSRRNQINRQQLQYQKLEHLQQAQEDGLRQSIIELYQNVLLDRKVLALRQQAYYSAQVNYQLAEKQFKNGEILLSEMSQLNDRYINAAIEQQNARSRYETAFMVLEDFVGGKISVLMTAPAK